MALSNLRNEPRREIIEQVAGVAIFAFYIAVVYGVVAWLGAKTSGDWIFGMLLTAFGLPIVGAMLFLIAHGLHALGEGVCALLANFGADPRPTERYRRR